MAKKKSSKRPKNCRAASGSQSRKVETYAFLNNEGKIIYLPGSATIHDLLKMGIKRISMEPRGSAMPTSKQVYVHDPLD